MQETQVIVVLYLGWYLRTASYNGDLIIYKRADVPEPPFRLCSLWWVTKR